MIRRKTEGKQKQLEKLYGKKDKVKCGGHSHDNPCTGHHGGIKDFDEFKGLLKDVTPVVDWLNPNDVDQGNL